MVSSAWLAAHWPQIAAAAQHAHAAAGSAPGASSTLKALSAAEAVQIEALASEIIPSGATPGAREARVLYFIDFALTSFFASAAPQFREQLAGFIQSFDAANPGAGGFAAAGRDKRIAYLTTVDRTPFFEMTRFLTVLGFLASPRYGGNAEGLGWKAIGFEDQHVFTPPFGYYDRDYPGFVPYTPEKR